MFTPSANSPLPLRYPNTISASARNFLSFFENNCMSTYKQIFYHLIFSTKHREKTLTEEHHEDLYKYIWGITQEKHGTLYRINGTEDHLHIFSDLHPSLSLAGFIKDIKLASSSWMKESGLFPRFTYWQDGYGAFTHSVKERDGIIRYVKNQKEHHRQESFLDEYRRLLVENEIPFEEKYLL
jgi:REP element-mobilizing transposase RayT